MPLRYLFAEPDTFHDTWLISGIDVTAHFVFCSIAIDSQKCRSALAIPSDEVSSVQCEPGVGGRSEPETPKGVGRCKILMSMIKTLGALHRFIRSHRVSEAPWIGSLVCRAKNTPRRCDAHLTFHRNILVIRRLPSRPSGIANAMIRSLVGSASVRRCVLCRVLESVGTMSQRGCRGGTPTQTCE